MPEMIIRHGPAPFGDLECLCGNTPISEGFESCLPDGTPVEPTVDGPWDEKSVLCWRCGRVIDQDTLAVTAWPGPPGGATDA